MWGAAGAAWDSPENIRPLNSARSTHLQVPMEPALIYHFVLLAALALCSDRHPDWVVWRPESFLRRGIPRDKQSVLTKVAPPSWGQRRIYSTAKVVAAQCSFGAATNLNTRVPPDATDPTALSRAPRESCTITGSVHLEPPCRVAMHQLAQDGTKRRAAWTPWAPRPTIVCVATSGGPG